MWRIGQSPPKTSFGETILAQMNYLNSSRLRLLSREQSVQQCASIFPPCTSPQGGAPRCRVNPGHAKTRLHSVPERMAISWETLITTPLLHSCVCLSKVVCLGGVKASPLAFLRPTPKSTFLPLRMYSAVLLTCLF